MKKTIFLGLAAVISLTSASAFAAGDDQYPAANFQPKVIYTDSSVASAKPAEAKCTEAKPEAGKVEFDPKYPAANFQPKVIYP